ncbi:MAG: hypothetical protein J6W72_06220 [Candidatus Methanomethylophilaceae archaeon]|nr:hypothetical protein [Candidatus Methanomethylophilaceae archaeon]
MSLRNGNATVAIMLVVLMMAASIGMFFMMQILSTAHPDPHEDSHDYIFEGTLDGVACSGTGTSTYTPETTREYDYLVEYTIHTADRSVSDSFFLFFDSDEKLIPKFFEYVGTETIGDVTTDVYTYEDTKKQIDYKLYTSGPCILYRVIIDAADYHVIGNVILDQ